MAKILTIGNVDNYTHRMKDPSKGLMFSEIALDSTIRVDFHSAADGDSNVIPELPVSQLLDMFNGLQYRGIVEQISVDTVKNFLLPFSFDGVLLFNEDDYFIVQINGITLDSTDVFNVDDINEGHPITVKKADIKVSDTDQAFNFDGYSHLFFPNGLPDLLEVGVTDSKGKKRKVQFDTNQLQTMSDENRITTFSEYDVTDQLGVAGLLSLNNFHVGTLNPVIPIGRITECIIHKTGGEFIFYKIAA